MSKAFSLIEILVATSIFSIINLVAVSVFLLSLQAQKSVLHEKTVAENIRFALEFASRQMRFAHVDALGTCTAAGEVFSDGGGSIRFLNSDDVCVNINLDNAGITYQEGNSAASNLTSRADIQVRALYFVIRGNGEQPRVTMIIDGVSAYDASLGLRAQTTTTLRNLSF